MSGPRALPAEEGYRLASFDVSCYDVAASKGVGRKGFNQLAQRQLNIRIEEGVFDVLAAAAYIEGVAPPDVVRAFLKAHVNELERDPEVMDALRAKRARDKKREDERGRRVSSLDAKRRRSY